MSTLPKSILTKKNVKQKGPFNIGGGEGMLINIRWDDQRGNGQNRFTITCDIYKNKRNIGGGSDHALIVKHCPELENAVRYHLVSADGPMHYIANTMYWAKEGHLEYARSTAVWSDAELEDFTEEALAARLPALMSGFKVVVESLGFIY